MPRTLLLSALIAVLAPAAHAEERFAPYAPTRAHARPVVAVIGENGGTELTDFVIPFAVLQRSGAVDTFAVATRPGEMRMRPALRLQPEFDVAGFDARFPEGADYVIVPAVVQRDDAVLLDWIRAQHAKGAMIVSICDGALVVANTGVMAGHRATAHWATESHRRQAYPQITWVANTRYVVDGDIASTSGISASIPASLALLEAIAGTEKAREVGAGFGVTAWTPEHDSDTFKPRAGNLLALAKVTATNRWFHSTQQLGVPLQEGMDDVALALTADAWSRTGRSQAYSVADAQQVRSRAGLVWLTDQHAAPPPSHRIDVKAPDGLPLFDAVLTAIAGRYGRSTAKGVAIDFEYPWAGTVR